MVAIHLVTFGSDDYKPQLERIRKEALHTGWFTTIHTFLPQDLDPAFLTKHRSFLQGRGYGYWIWKPQVIRQVFDTLSDGDILVYADAGCTLNPGATPQMKSYIQLAETHPSGIVCCMMYHTVEKQYTKREVFERLGYEHADSPQILAGISIFRKCRESASLLYEWSELTQDYALIDDTKGPQDPEFRDHRHDQSIWSILNKKAGTCMVSSQVMVYNGNKDSPIWDTRIRGSQVSPYTETLFG